MEKKIIMYFIIVFIIAIVIFSIFVIIKKDKMSVDLAKEQDMYLHTQNNPGAVINGLTPNKVNITGLYFSVDNCIKNYFITLNNKSSDIIITYLNEEYIGNNNINKQNVIEKLEKYNDYDSYRTYEMYTIGGLNYSYYYVKGRIDKKDVYFEVGLDSSNNTFDIMPITKEEYNNTIITPHVSKSNNEKNISKKNYNITPYRKLDDNEIGIEYVCDYISLMLKDPDEAYLMLSEEYRNKKYSNKNDFFSYIQSNKEKFELIYKIAKIDFVEFDNYSQKASYLNLNKKFIVDLLYKTEKNEYVQYVCSNQNEDYFIFNVSNPGIYEVLLDSSML